MSYYGRKFRDGSVLRQATFVQRHDTIVRCVKPKNITFWFMITGEIIVTDTCPQPWSKG